MPAPAELPVWNRTQLGAENGIVGCVAYGELVAATVATHALMVAHLSCTAAVLFVEPDRVLAWCSFILHGVLQRRLRGLLPAEEGLQVVAGSNQRPIWQPSNGAENGGMTELLLQRPMSTFYVSRPHGVHR